MSHEVFRHLPFPFADGRFPDELGAVALRSVVDGSEPVRSVRHSSENDWSFTDLFTDPNAPGAATVVCVKDLIVQDPSLAETATLPIGHYAERAEPGCAWNIRPEPAVLASTPTGWTIEDPSAQDIRRLLAGVASGEEDYFILDRLQAENDEFYAQVTLHPSGAFQLEYRDGTAGSHFQATTDDPDRASATLTAWSNDGPGWRDSLAWTRLMPDGEWPAGDCGPEQRT